MSRQNGSIWTVPKSSASPKQIASNAPGYSTGVAVSDTDVYWTVPSFRDVHPSKSDMNVAGTKFSAGFHPVGIAVDTKYVYWSDWGLASGGVEYEPFGGTKAQVLAEGQGMVGSLAASAGVAYWVAQNNGDLSSAPAGSTTKMATVLAQGQAQTNPQLIAANGSDVYRRHRRRHHIVFTVGVSSVPLQIVTVGQATINGLAADATGALLLDELWTACRALRGEVGQPHSSLGGGGGGRSARNSAAISSSAAPAAWSCLASGPGSRRDGAFLAGAPRAEAAGGGGATGGGAAGGGAAGGRASTWRSRDEGRCARRRWGCARPTRGGAATRGGGEIRAGGATTGAGATTDGGGLGFPALGVSVASPGATAGPASRITPLHGALAIGAAAALGAPSAGNANGATGRPLAAACCSGRSPSVLSPLPGAPPPPRTAWPPCAPPPG